MVFPLDVALQLGGIEIHFAQIAGAVALGLIVEVRRAGIAALAAGRHGPGADAVAELDHGDEAVAAGPVDLLRVRCRRARRTKRANPSVPTVNGTGMLGPASLNGCTMSSVRRWKRLMSPHGVFQVPKSAVSLSEAAASASQQLLRRRRARRCSRRPARRAARASAAARRWIVLAPEDRERRRDRRRRPAQIPARAAARSARPASP